MTDKPKSNRRDFLKGKAAVDAIQDKTQRIVDENPIVSPYTGEVVAVDTSKTRTMQADAEDAQSNKMKEASEEEHLVLDDDDDDDDVDLGDDVLDDDDDEDTVSLDELADVAANGDDD